jgi:hypothetical protein
MAGMLFILCGAVLMLFMGFRMLRAQRRLRREGTAAEARVAGTGENRDGRYYVLEIETAGGTHRLHYPMARRGSVWAPGTALKLYYDPLHPEKLWVEGDRAAQAGMYYYFGLGAVLVALSLLLMPR